MAYLSNRGPGESFYLGWFATEAALISAYPVGADGYFAMVGTTDTIWAWDSDTSAWIDTGASASTADLQAVTDLGSVTTNDIEALSFTKTGGVATEFLKADGSVDTNTYLTAEADTLQSVTDRGASTTIQSTFSGGLLSGLGTALLPSYSFAGDTNTGMWRPLADTLAWSTNGVERMRVLSSGNVGIGTTTPGALLDVGGKIATSAFPQGRPTAMISDNYNGIAGVEMRNTNTGTSNDFRFLISDTTGNYLTFSQPGVNFVTPLFGITRGQGSFIFNGSGTTRDLGIGTTGANKLVLGTNSLARMTIASDGNIGIGTTSPSEKLDVVGNIEVSGTVDGIDIATDVAANTAKVTNATHTGDVTGSGALTIGSKKVTLGMMADGTVGELITYDAGGVAAKVAAGTAAQVLTSNGAGAAPTFQDAAIINDTTPQLGGELDAGAHSIGFTMQTATGDGTTTVDWKLGNHIDFTFGAFNETFTFTAPTKPGVYTMSLKQDSVGSRTATFPATVKWAGGTAPTLTTTATTGYDIISFRFDGTNYYAVGSLDFS